MRGRSAHGLKLIEVDAETDAPSDVEPDTSTGEAAISKWLGCYYFEVFDPNPTLHDVPCLGDIGDDLLDVYRDIKRGLELFNLGFPQAAQWDWAFHFRAHWGRHAAAALLALHELVHSRPAAEPLEPENFDESGRQRQR